MVRHESTIRYSPYVGGGLLVPGLRPAVSIAAGVMAALKLKRSVRVSRKRQADGLPSATAARIQRLASWCAQRRQLQAFCTRQLPNSTLLKDIVPSRKSNGEAC